MRFRLRPEPTETPPPVRPSRSSLTSASRPISSRRRVPRRAAKEKTMDASPPEPTQDAPAGRKPTLDELLVKHRKWVAEGRRLGGAQQRGPASESPEAQAPSIEPRPPETAEPTAAITPAPAMPIPAATPPAPPAFPAMDAGTVAHPETQAVDAKATTAPVIAGSGATFTPSTAPAPATAESRSVDAVAPPPEPKPAREPKRRPRTWREDRRAA